MIGKLFDVTVIGSNLSGLVAAALLVKRSYNVLVVDLESERRQITRGDYTLKQFPSLFYGFGPKSIFSDIFGELGIPVLEKKRFSLAEPAFQIVMPHNRIDVIQGREKLFKVLNNEFPSQATDMMSFFNDIDSYASAISSFLSQDIVFPPSTIREGLRARRAAKQVLNAFKGVAKIDYDSFLDSYNFSPDAKAFIDSQTQFLSSIYQDEMPIYKASYLLGRTNNGIFKADGGIKALEDICKERISSYRGAFHYSQGIEEINFGKIINIKFPDVREMVKTKYILHTGNPAKFIQTYSPKHFKGALRDMMKLEDNAAHSFSLYLGIDENVVPVGMTENVILISDPTKPLIDENMIFLRLSHPNDTGFAPQGKRLLAATIKVQPEGKELTMGEAQTISQELHGKIENLMPFLKDNLDFVAVEESFALYQAKRHASFRPTIDPDDKFGVSFLTNRLPHKQIFYTGPAVLPGLGIEGEGYSAMQVANMLSRQLLKG